MHPSDKSDFIAALENVYGPFRDLTLEAAQAWTPPPMAEGHLGRYLWTDGTPRAPAAPRAPG